MAINSVLPSPSGQQGSYGGVNYDYVLTNSNGHKYSIASTLDAPDYYPSIHVDKSVDGGLTWVNVPALDRNASDLAVDLILHFGVSSSGDSFYFLVFVRVGGFDYVRVYVLDTIAETFTYTGGPHRKIHYSSAGGIGVLSSGNIVAFYQQPYALFTSYAKNALTIYSGGSWGADIDVPRFDSAYSSVPVQLLVGASDRIHLFSSIAYGLDSNPSPQYDTHARMAPPLYHVCYNGSSFGSVSTVLPEKEMWTGTYGSNPRLGNAVAYNDGSGDKIAIGFYGFDADDTQFGDVVSATINSAGSGWTAGDQFDIEDGDFNALGVVDSVDGGGGVLTFHLTELGSGYATSNNVATADWDGPGIDFTLDIIANPVSPMSANAAAVKCVHGDDAESPSSWTIRTVQSSSILEWPMPGGWQDSYTSDFLSYGTASILWVREVQGPSLYAYGTSLVMFYCMNSFSYVGQLNRSVFSGAWASPTVFRQETDTTPLLGYLFSVLALGPTTCMRVRSTDPAYHIYSDGLTGGSTNYVSAGGPGAARGKFAAVG